MAFAKDTSFYQLLATKYDAEREDEAIEILDEHPEIAQLEWPGPDSKGEPFVKGSTALHYAANDGKLKLVRRLIEGGADPNASNACWFRSVLSWAANNARIETINFSWSREPVPILSMHYTPLPGAARLVGRERNGSMPRRSSCSSKLRPK